MLDSTSRGSARRFILLLALAAPACGGKPPAESPSSGSDTNPTPTPALEAPPAAPEAAPVTPPAPTKQGPRREEEPAATTETGGDFQRLNTHTAKNTHGVKRSKLKPTKTEAVLKFVVVDKDAGEPIEGVVVSLTGPNDKKYYTKSTDAKGYAEVLVPAGKKYELVYLSLRGRDIGATLQVENKERFTLKLTLRYKGYVGKTSEERVAPLVLDGVNFDTGKATIRPQSFHRLDAVVEYMLHKEGSRIQISGHTDNVGDKKKNKLLSTRRAQACRNYLISKGIDGSRVMAIGYGDERPLASNDTAAGRQKNRRIEAIEER